MMKTTAFVFALIFFFNTVLSSKDYTTQDFIGTWNGVIESEMLGESLETTLTFNEDGTYHESSGTLMPTIYPETQTWKINSNNRLQLSYLSTVYAGQRTYQYFIYDVVVFENNMIELHYNFHQEENPQPNVQRIVLKKSTSHVENKFLTKELIRVVSPYGEELPLTTKGVPAIYIFNDGSIHKEFIQK